MGEGTPALIGFLRDDGRCQGRYVIRLITPEDKQPSRLFLYLSFHLFLSTLGDEISGAECLSSLRDAVIRKDTIGV